MIIYTEEEIIERCHTTREYFEMASNGRLIDMKTGEIYFQIPSRSGGEDHKVRFNAKYRRFYCTCQAGQAGTTCWAKKAAMAASIWHRQEENLQARAEAEKAEAEREARFQAYWNEPLEEKKEVEPIKPGTETLNPQGVKMELSPFGRWVPMA